MQDTAAAPSFTLLALFIAWLGPIVGPYALIIFAAVAGSGLALTVEKPTSRLEGLKFVALSTLVTLLLTGPLAWLVEKYTTVPANVALIPVAIVLSAARSRLLPLIHSALDAIAAAAGAALKAAASIRGGEQ